MAERVIAPIESAEVGQPSPEELAVAADQTATFVRDVAPHLGRVFGMDLQLRVGQLKEGGGMACDTERGEIIVDPRFFVEAGKGSPDKAEYGILHETAAHLLRAQRPALNKQVHNFKRQGKPQDIFNNILEDVAGNNLIHAALPRMKNVAADMYAKDLFPETDFTTDPRHLQFLYSIIRTAMVPDQQVAVLPEVAEALAGLRDFQGQGDVIAYSVAVAKSAREAMTAEERFGIWNSILYPVYEQLLEQDRQDPNFQNQSGDGGDSGEASEQQKGQQQSSEGQQQPNSNQQTDDERFGSYYQDYAENRHPEAMDEQEENKVAEQAQTAQKSTKQLNPEAAQRQQERAMDEKLRAETGHSLREQQQYNAEIQKWRPTIDDMREVYARIISERVAERRALSRRPSTEGAVLDPDRLVQTVIDVRNHVEEPEAFRDYVKRHGETSSVGKTDYVFLFDVSDSMGWEGGEKARAAAAAAVIGLEGLAALQRDIEAAEAEHRLDLELDIRTAIYTFGSTATCLKPLSTKLQQKERLDAYSAITHPSGGTHDFEALEAVEALEVDDDRKRILIAVSDGESQGETRARRAIDRLRGQGWYIYGVSIGSEEAVRLYRPTAKRVDDPALLPETIATFIEATIT